VRRVSLSGRIAVVTIGNVIIASLLVFVAMRAALAMDVRPLFAWMTALLVAIPIAVWSAHRVARRVLGTLEGLDDGVRALHDGDFSMRLAVDGNDEVAEIKSLYNEVADTMRAERKEIYQKELLLDTILQRTPVAVLLLNPADRIIYSNAAAREMFGSGTRLDGKPFVEVVENVAAPLRDALAAAGDAIVSIPNGEQDETLHLSQRVFHLNTQRHRLVLLERLTPELRRQEVAVWKKAIRLINHELNNTIAPISSLFHSARLVQEKPQHRHKLDGIYASIEERLGFLRQFLESYAQFARLPEPRRTWTRWQDLLDDVRALYDFQFEGTPPDDVFVDPAQMQQVLINLLKNAHESGTDPSEVTVVIWRSADGTVLRVADRGRGMSDDVMRQALLPFYSTKPGGTGLGLALSNEIIEAHGGRLRLQAREGGGTVVTAWLP
jgi:two-component system, NtrC family, nitrogen regulation sensor histidine kinase NtrY